MPKIVEIRFGARLLHLRADRKWTQEDLCERSGISREYISRLENGKQDPRLSILSALAKAFGMTISELMAGV